ncbi:hypothetical protein Btru_073821 [Bulinus truncatus]|nr:hypothetical protein Btru_073821 [Bulinus truncatus]
MLLHLLRRELRTKTLDNAVAPSKAGTKNQTLDNADINASVNRSCHQGLTCLLKSFVEYPVTSALDWLSSLVSGIARVQDGSREKGQRGDLIFFCRHQGKCWDFIKK